MDPRELALQFGGRLAFHGSIDTQQHSRSATRRRAPRSPRAHRDIQALRWIHHRPSQHLMPEIPTENIVAMYEAAWEYGRLE
jgi:hypothetical protein